MNKPFSQPKITYKICFNTNYQYIELFEKFFPEDILGISTSELESSTVDSKPDDIWRYEVFVGEKPELSALQKDLTIFAANNDLKINSPITFEIIEDKDWIKAYQEQLQPIEIGRFFITSSLRKQLCPKDKTPIYIEASRAFGTGDHSTTSLCIRAMEEIENLNVTNIFDIGTGSGILSFAAEKLWPKANILACDIEETSIVVAKDNQSFNDSTIEFYQNSETDLKIPSKWGKSFDLIVSNILSSPLIAMKDSIKSLCHKNTKIILSGFLDYQQKEIEDRYIESGFSIDKIYSENKWIAIIFKVNND
jgi:ribosomal protein L11 methyltransferase